MAYTTTDHELAQGFYQTALKLDNTFVAALLGYRSLLLAHSLIAPSVETLKTSLYERAVRAGPQAQGVAERFLSTQRSPTGRLIFALWNEVVKRNLPLAMSMYRELAMEGLAPAQNCLAQHLYAGLHIPKDFTQSFKWFQKAAMQHYPPGVCVLVRVCSYIRSPYRVTMCVCSGMVCLSLS